MEANVFLFYSQQDLIQLLLPDVGGTVPDGGVFDPPPVIEGPADIL